MKKCLLLLLFLPVLAATAQQNTVCTRPFVCGNRPRLPRISYEAGINQVFRPQVPNGWNNGFSSGISMDYPINYSLYFSPQFLISYMSYRDDRKRMELTNLEIPLHFLIRPGTIVTKDPLISIGADYKKMLGTSNRGRWFADIGIGFQDMFRYRAISPELRFSYSRDMQMLYFILHFRGFGEK